MAASLDDDFECNNQDYYSLLNVRKEVGLLLLSFAVALNGGVPLVVTFRCISMLSSGLDSMRLPSVEERSPSSAPSSMERHCRTTDQSFCPTLINMQAVSAPGRRCL